MPWSLPGPFRLLTSEHLTGNQEIDVDISRHNCSRFQCYLHWAQADLFKHRLEEAGFEYDRELNRFHCNGIDVRWNEESFVRSLDYRYSNRFTSRDLKSLLQLLDSRCFVFLPTRSEHELVRRDIRREMYAPAYVLTEHAIALLKAMHLYELCDAFDKIGKPGQDADQEDGFIWVHDVLGSADN